MNHTHIPLHSKVLRWHADEANLHGLTGGEKLKLENVNDKTNEIACLRDCTLGQDRGVTAFRFGMAMQGRGYNIFVTGPSVEGDGTGGTARIDTLGIVKHLLKENFENGKNTNVPDDLCYVRNFDKVEEPILLRFKAGVARKFNKDVCTFVDSVMREMVSIFEKAEYTVKKNHITDSYERKTRELFKIVEGKVRDAGFAIINMQMNGGQQPDIAPLIDGEPVPLRKIEELQEKGEILQVKLEELKETYTKLKDVIDAVFLQVREVQREKKGEMAALDTTLFQNMLSELAHDLFSYKDEKVQAFVESMLRNMVKNLNSLRQLASERFSVEKTIAAKKDAQSPQAVPASHLLTLAPSRAATETATARCPMVQANDPLSLYQINILVDNSQLTGPPIIYESYPTYRNLFGSIECSMGYPMAQCSESKARQNGCRKIQAGSFIKANGGYLVLNLRDVIAEVGVWPTLKRALKNKAMEIQTFDPYYFMLSSNIKPEPIEIHVKVIVLATPQLYHLLRHQDDDVARVFKVWADFDASMSLDNAALHHIRQCMQGIVYEEGLLPFTPSAVASLLELGVRHAGRREKISIAFPQLRDIMEEANYMALTKRVKSVESEEGGVEYGEVTAQDVEAALQARRHRAGQVEEKMQEAIDRGTILIDTKGLAVGQVNGLAVLSIGHHQFGKPTRITVTSAMGKAGLVNIEREAELSGAAHTKGVLILTGYMNRMFGQKRPLVLSASIAFEQSYGGVDGDSASSTEVYALLSSLSGVPIKQGIAVTGSVNQMGEVQAIGGVNEKVEGFYDCCVHAGLTGEQGVMIPYANVQDLMLDVRVVDAVERGEFHVWAVKNISEGIEILTGYSSGVVVSDTCCYFEEGSVFAQVDARLTQMADAFYKQSPQTSLHAL